MSQHPRGETTGGAPWEKKKKDTSKTQSLNLRFCGRPRRRLAPRKFRAEGEAVLLQWKTEVRTGNTSQPGGRGE